MRSSFKNIIYFLIVCLALVAITAKSHAAHKTYYRTVVNDGSAASLDALDGDDLNDGDRCFVMTSSLLYFYRLNASSGATEDDPTIITPNTNAGSKRWILIGVSINYDSMIALTSGSGDGQHYHEELTDSGGSTTLELDGGGGAMISNSSDAEAHFTVTGDTADDIANFTLHDSGSSNFWQMNMRGSDDPTYPNDFNIRYNYGTGYQYALTIDEDRNVGIGTRTPTTALHVKGTAPTLTIESTTDNATLTLNSGTDGAGGEYSSIQFQTNGNNKYGISKIDTEALQFYDYINSKTIMMFTNGGHVYLNGNTGIGTLSPGYKLEVNGTAHVTGEFTAGTKTFMIDHPLAPTEKILYHAVFEGPEHGLIYRGVAQLKDGKAVVDIDKSAGMTPGTFNVLAQSAVVQSLQNQDSFDRVKPGKFNGAEFEIICENESSTDTIAWMVMAERKDPLVKHSVLNDADGHLIVEVDKDDPTPDELAQLADVEKVVETDAAKASIETTEKVDVLTHKKGYLMVPEAYGADYPTRKLTTVYNLIKTEKEKVQ